LGGLDKEQEHEEEHDAGDACGLGVGFINTGPDTPSDLVLLLHQLSVPLILLALLASLLLLLLLALFLLAPFWVGRGG